ncbi:ATP-grasp fold amidoligase family protein [Ectothiorhodospira marina]|nr:ATP-grasp fold amidoligase family protein [Ectothiorhodospira marina]
MPSLMFPGRLSELIQHKKLNAKDILVAFTSDKEYARQYVKAVVGEQYLIPCHGIFRSAEEIPFDRFPDAFALKGTHGSGYNVIVRDKHGLPENLVQTLAAWGQANYYWVSRDWGYKYLTPKFIVEELLVHDGALAVDYKIFVFSGKARLIQLDFDRYTKHSQAFFNENWKRLNISFGAGLQYPQQVPRPDRLEDAITVAEALGAAFDLVRIDLYLHQGNIYFGEFTHYHLSGFWSKEFDEVDRELFEVFSEDRPIAKRFYMD